MVVQQLQSFLEKYGVKKPLLLAFSGGPDSRALFHALLEVGHPFHAAHVDHGWREESRLEAQELKDLCATYSIPFYLHCLDPAHITGNREDYCRKARLQFFKEIIEKEELLGVLLAHHADDQAETVLKRLFEGASLPKLAGLKPLSTIDGLTLLRPLLGVEKKTLLTWLSDRSLPYFVDPTNGDTRYLRSRMRAELMPELARLFGKGITSSLCRVGKSAAELGEFLESTLETYRNQVTRNGKEVELDLSQNQPDSEYLWKSVLRDFFEKEGVAIPQTILETVLFHLHKRNANRELIVGKRRVVIHRQRVKLMS